MMHYRSLLRLVLPTAFVVAVSTSAGAQSYLADPRTGCHTINCVSQTIKGAVPSIQEYGYGNERRAAHFIVNVYASAHECLRLEVVSAEEDLAMAVLAPTTLTPNTWEDDDSAGDLHPRVIINDTPIAGWYTVLLRVWDGISVDADFTMQYGRYPRGNINCQPETFPAAMAVEGNGRAAQSAPPKQPRSSAD
jgi:hypothetical protein